MSQFETAMVGDVPVARLSLPAALEAIANSTQSGRSVHFVNSNTVVDAREKSDYRALLEATWLNLPDGAPVAWVLRRNSGEEISRIPGPDVFNHFMLKTENEGQRHFLIGGTESTLERISALAKANIVGSISPPFTSHDAFDIEDFANQVRSTAATHVWIGLGSPKQDFVATRLAAETDATVLGVGAAFDFLAETKRRAPFWMQRLNLEWLYRLLSEPQRLWKRYLVGNFQFLRIALGK